MIHLQVIDNEIHIHIVGDSRKTFKTILDRALNVWPDCPAEWKSMADIVIHGTTLQKYRDGIHTVSADNIHHNHDYYTPQMQQFIQGFITKYGEHEWHAYTLKSHQQSLSAWINEMRAKYPEL
jgi:hypothetical protein